MILMRGNLHTFASESTELRGSHPLARFISRKSAQTRANSFHADIAGSPRDGATLDSGGVGTVGVVRGFGVPGQTGMSSRPPRSWGRRRNGSWRRRGHRHTRPVLLPLLPRSHGQCDFEETLLPGDPSGCDNRPLRSVVRTRILKGHTVEGGLSMESEEHFTPISP